MLSRACDLFVLTPWAVFVAVSAGPAILSSISHWERFPDTGNPGYLIIKLALWLMAGLILLAVAVGLLGGDAGRKR